MYNYSRYTLELAQTDFTTVGSSFTGSEEKEGCYERLKMALVFSAFFVWKGWHSLEVKGTGNP